jgi:ribosome-binding protein aMBF1 (putative translation factor)
MGATVLRRESLGPCPNEGARLLWEQMRELGLSIAGLAKRLKADRGLVNRWLWCNGMPGREWAGEIERELGIPIGAWGQKPTRKIRTEYRLRAKTGTEG